MDIKFKKMPVSVKSFQSRETKRKADIKYSTKIAFQGDLTPYRAAGKA